MTPGFTPPVYLWDKPDQVISGDKPGQLIRAINRKAGNQTGTHTVSHCLYCQSVTGCNRSPTLGYNYSNNSWLRSEINSRVNNQLERDLYGIRHVLQMKRYWLGKCASPYIDSLVPRRFICSLLSRANAFLCFFDIFTGLSNDPGQVNPSKMRTITLTYHRQLRNCIAYRHCNSCS